MSFVKPDEVACQAVNSDGEARRGFGSSFGHILKFGLELKNMVWHIFGRKRSDPRKEAEGARARSCRGFNLIYSRTRA